ncbi:MAG: hypothetical protein IJP31_00235 [Lachnospiraceae bacterium]|nr:hypothetical protein [Lachnospiraceae bacterium]
MDMDEVRFEEVKKRILETKRERSGIGTLSEKTVHAVLKNYYQPDESCQEVKLERMVADIFTGKEILEIQTRNFFSLKKKLSVFLSLYPVTIIYPLPAQKWLIWIDPETGEFSEKRKSPKTGNLYDAFKELGRIKEFLDHKNLTIKIVFLDMEEYRLLNGWSRDRKRGSHRYDRIPLKLVREVELTRPEDYLQLIPYELEEPFDVKGFAKAAKIKQDRASQVLSVLYYLGQVKRIGKRGNAYLYRVRDDD